MGTEGGEKGVTGITNCKLVTELRAPMLMLMGVASQLFGLELFQE